MKDIVTFETAVRLKEAGFPQPTPEAGQFWYGKDREVGYIFYCERLALLSGEIVYFDAPEKCVFAPTATDILRELDDLFFIRKSTYESKPIFSVFDEKRAENGFNVALSVDYNPAETLAKAWLKLKQNDQKTGN